MVRLYGVTLQGLQSTLRMFGGRKWNPLRKRVDSGSFTWDQLCLGMFIASSLLLLLPTILVYYIVFLAVCFIVFSSNQITLLISCFSYLHSWGWRYWPHRSPWRGSLGWLTVCHSIRSCYGFSIHHCWQVDGLLLIYSLLIVWIILNLLQEMSKWWLWVMGCSGLYRSDCL